MVDIPNCFVQYAMLSACISINSGMGDSKYEYRIQISLSLQYVLIERKLHTATQPEFHVQIYQNGVTIMLKQP